LRAGIASNLRLQGRYPDHSDIDKKALSGDPIEITSYFDLAIGIHHIFPKGCCENKYKRIRWNSSVKKAPLSAKTTRIIGGKAPSFYLANIEKQSNMDSPRLNEILKTHKIAPDLIRSDMFEKFIRDRASNLLDLIETALGKRIFRKAIR
jgi:hypothetical protein